MSKPERLEFRLSAEDKTLIGEAAGREDTTVTEFVRAAALERAERVRARAERTLMPAEQFDALLATLSEPDDAPALAEVFARPRPFVQS